MKTTWWMVPVLALALVGCADDGDDPGLTAGDSVGVVGADEDSIAMEPAHMPAAGMDQPPGGIGQTAQFNALGGSGVTGEVTIADRGEQAEVMVRLTGSAPNSSHPGHIHSGTCEAIGGVVQPLDPIDTDGTGTGSMTTNVGINPMTLMDGQHVVVYHGTGGRPITCAQIPGHTM